MQGIIVTIVALQASKELCWVLDKVMWPITPRQNCGELSQEHNGEISISGILAVNQVTAS